MAILNSTKYNTAGELLAPNSIDMLRHMNVVEAMPTMDRGFYHRFEIRSRKQTEKIQKVRQFLSILRMNGGKIITFRDERELGEFQTIFFYVIERS